MAQGFGYRFALGVAPELVYGTAAAPSGYMEIAEESLAFKSETKPREVLGKSYSDDYVGSKQSVEGSVTWPATYENAVQETIYKRAFGAVSTAPGSGFYTHTFTLSDNVCVSGLTFYIDPDAQAVGQAQYFTGCGINSLSLSQEAENYLQASVDLIGAGHSFTTRKTPTIPAFKGVKWNQVSSVTLDGDEYGARVVEFQVENALADDRYNLGNRQRVGLGRGGVRKVGGKVSIEVSDTTLIQSFKDGAEIAIAATWTGPIVSGVPYSMTLNIPRAVLQGNVQAVGEQGPQVIEYPFIAFSAEGSGNEISLQVVNTHSSIL